jgi:hypothetical protein
MKINPAFVFIGTSLIAGCAANVDGQGGTEQEGTSAQALTVTQCASQRTACFANNPLFGLFTCPAQYAKCALTASNGLPAQINQAVSDAAACNTADLECTNAATTAPELVACTTTEAECVGAILQVTLPTIVTGTATCVENSIKCVNAAEVVSDLTTCANNLASCAVAQAETVVPEQVGVVIGDVNTCNTTLNSCIAAAATPVDLTTCSVTGATCVASALGVTLPSEIEGVIQCTQTAASCALQSTDPENVAYCANTLASCAAAAVGANSNPPLLTCAQKWTACIAKNPFNFLACDHQLATCTN